MGNSTSKKSEVRPSTHRLSYCFHKITGANEDIFFTPDIVSCLGRAWTSRKVKRSTAARTMATLQTRQTGSLLSGKQCIFVQNLSKSSDVDEQPRFSMLNRTIKTVVKISSNQVQNLTWSWMLMNVGWKDNDTVGLNISSVHRKIIVAKSHWDCKNRVHSYLFFYSCNKMLNRLTPNEQCRDHMITTTSDWHCKWFQLYSHSWFHVNNRHERISVRSAIVCPT